MQLRVLLSVGGLIAALAAGGCGASAAGAGCTQSTLKGNYIYAYDGFQVSGETATQRMPFAWAGRDTWHGDGTMSGTGSGGVNGVPGGVTSYTGTYTLNADCTGSLVFTDSSGGSTHWDLYVLENGARIAYVQTDPGYVAAGSEQRQ